MIKKEEKRNEINKGRERLGKEESLKVYIWFLMMKKINMMTGAPQSC